MTASSYRGPFPKPQHVPPLKTIHPRPLLPLHEIPPALLLYPPSLPQEASERIANANDRTDGIFEHFDVSTHIVPAAYPRMAPYVPPSYLSPDDVVAQEGKQAREDRAARLTDKLLKLNVEQKEGKFPPNKGENRVLWNVLNRYRRKAPNSTSSSNVKGVTLLLAHANGFPKEVRI